MVATGLAYDSDVRRAQGRVLERLVPRVRDIRRFGSAALDSGVDGGRPLRRVLRALGQAVGHRRRRADLRARRPRGPRARAAREPSLGDPRRAAGARAAVARAGRGPMSEQARKARRFLEQHRGETPLLLANAWDRGLGEAARFARLRGARDDEQRLRGDARTARRQRSRARRRSRTRRRSSTRRAAGLGRPRERLRRRSGGRRRDGRRWRSTPGWPAARSRTSPATIGAPIYELARGDRADRSGSRGAHSGPAPLVLTARAENFLHGRADLADTIARLQAYAEAGADVLYAPGPTDREQLRAIVASVELPVNVLVRPGGPSVAELAALGVEPHLGRRRVRVRRARRRRRGRRRAARAGHVSASGSARASASRRRARRSAISRGDARASA